MADGLRSGARRLGEGGRALGRRAAIAAPHVRRGARTGAHWTSERGLRAAGVSRIWVGRAGEASYRAAIVGGRRGGAALGSTARQAGALAVAAGTSARTTALSEAAHLGTVTLVPVALERDGRRGAGPGGDGATRVLAGGPEASGAAAAGDDTEVQTDESVTERSVDPSPPGGEPTVRASVAAAGRAGTTEQTVEANAPARETKRPGGPKRTGEPTEGVAVAEAGADAPVAPVGKTNEWIDGPSEAVADAEGRADAPDEGVAETEGGADVPGGPAGEASAPTDASNAPAAEADERVDAATQATQTKKESRSPSEPIREANEEADAAAERKSRSRKRPADRGDVASEAATPGPAGDDAGAADSPTQRTTRAKRTPRTTTPQGERTPQQSR